MLVTSDVQIAPDFRQAVALKKMIEDKISQGECVADMVSKFQVGEVHRLNRIS